MDRLQSTVVRYEAHTTPKSPPRKQTTKNQDALGRETLSDMEIDRADKAAFNAMVMTKDDYEELDKSVKEFENLEMDDEMIDNDDFL